MVVDTSALMAILFGEPDAARIAAALSTAKRLRMAAPTWLESLIVVEGRKGPDGVEQLRELVQGLGIEFVDFDTALAERAHLAWRSYGKGRHPAALNMGDCYAYALASALGEALLFKGEDFSQTDIQPVLG
jgi:Uncharacterized protein conserved in bacteria